MKTIKWGIMTIGVWFTIALLVSLVWCKDKSVLSIAFSMFFWVAIFWIFMKCINKIFLRDI